MKRPISIFFVFLIQLNLYSQPESQVIDKVIAVVGESIVLKSELEKSMQQYLQSGEPVTNNTRCELFEDLLFQKLLLNQSQIDSVEVSENQIQNEIDRRLRYFINQIGSEKKLEEYYQKSIAEIKAEFHDIVKEQLLVQTMQGKINANVKVTPAEVKSFYDKIPKDSLPFISSEIEVAQIVKKPPVSEEEKKAVKEKLESIKKRIKQGEDFGTLAVLYSEDPGSSRKNGDLGFVTRATLVPEFAAVAFKLKEGQVSDIVETEYGFHVIQMVERRGEEARLKHILIAPKISPQDLIKSKEFLDSLYAVFTKTDTISFESIALQYSDDKDSKMNGGKLVNPVSGTTKFSADILGQYDPSMFFAIEKMKDGEITPPALYIRQDGSKAYRIIKLISRTEPHRANLKDDYQAIQEVAQLQKQEKAMTDWMVKKIAKTYISINDDLKNCSYQVNWDKSAEQ
jgi:peptidyl-prolyl cis-trans isomerase SurA